MIQLLLYLSNNQLINYLFVPNGIVTLITKIKIKTCKLKKNADYIFLKLFSNLKPLQ